MPGKPIAELQREHALDDVIKLASNENPLGASPRVPAVISDCASGLHRYPDTHCYGAIGAIASRLGMPREMLVVGSGSVEVMKWIAESLLELGMES